MLPTHMELETSKGKKNITFLKRNPQFRGAVGNCSMFVKGLPKGAPDAMRGRIVETADCDAFSLMASLNKELPDLTDLERRAIQNQYCPFENDYIILELPELSKVQTPCLPLSHQRPTVGETIFNVGVPGGHTNRGFRDTKPYDESGWLVHADRGKIVEQNYCESVLENRNEPIFMKTENPPPIGNKYNFPEHIQMILARGVHLQSTADAVGGMSGGPLVTTDGKHGGVASFIHDIDGIKNSTVECVGSVFYIRTDYIVSHLQQRASNEGRTIDPAILNCN